MWGRRRNRGGLSKQLSLGMLEDAIARAEQPAGTYRETAGPVPSAPYPAAGPPQPRTAASGDLSPADVPVDNTAGPAAADAVPPRQRQRRGEHTAESTRPGSLG